MRKYIFIFLSLFLLAHTVSAQTTELDPIVIVPGIMASFNLDVLFDPSPTPTVEGWKITPKVKQYDQLIKALEDSGLVQGEDFFIAFYDWRQSNSDSAQNYLIPVIDEAFTHSDTGKVDIVAHSMGGLVARSYIQSDEYRDDVDQFIMLGTPNHGSSDVYTLWEGGEIPDNWEKAQKNILDLYLWYMTKVTSQTEDDYDTIHNFVPSVGEMTPTYDFLTNKDSGDRIAVGDMQEQNIFLQDLNTVSEMFEITTKVSDIYSIAGEGELTVGDIPVVPHTEENGKLWTDGQPDPITPERNTTEGDNRVLNFSAFLPDLPPPLPTKADDVGPLERFFSWIFPAAYAQFGGGGGADIRFTLPSTHGGLPTTAIPDVARILTDTTIPEGEYQVLPDPDEILSFWFASPVAVKIIAPGGGEITKDINTIPGAVYEGQTDPLGVKMVLIENPASGTYTVELTGLADGTYHFATAFFNAAGNDVIQTVEHSVAEGDVLSHTVSFDPLNTETPAPISEPGSGGEEEPEPTPEELLELFRNALEDMQMPLFLKKQLTVGSLIVEQLIKKDRIHLAKLAIKSLKFLIDRWTSHGIDEEDAETLLDILERVREGL